MEKKNIFFNICAAGALGFSIFCLGYVLIKGQNKKNNPDLNINSDFITKQIERIYFDWIDTSVDGNNMLNEPDSVLVGSNDYWIDFDKVPIPERYVLLNIPYEGCGTCMYQQFEILEDFSLSIDRKNYPLIIMAPIVLQREILILKTQHKISENVRFFFLPFYHQALLGASNYRLSYNLIERGKVLQTFPDPPQSSKIVSYYLDKAISADK